MGERAPKPPPAIQAVLDTNVIISAPLFSAPRRNSSQPDNPAAFGQSSLPLCCSDYHERQGPDALCCAAGEAERSRK